MGATLLGTKTYFAESALTPVVFGRTGWKISPVGFGCYRVSDSDPTHRAALSLALTSGCNLIDTSTNYTDGSSETAVGRVLGQLISEKKISREQIVVVTKAGYVQGENLALAKARIKQGQPFSEMVKFSEDCWHCISPDFLKDQIDRSLARLKLDQLDVLLLHNPEYFLKTNDDHAEYYRRITKAFEYLETEVARGRIQYYGISSNTFPDPKKDPHYTSLETVVEIAEKLSASHHFAVIQFPMNLYEQGAATEPNNSGPTGAVTLVEYAATKNLGTLVNRPLNAFHHQKMVRLADFPSHHGIDTVRLLKESLARAMELESAYPAKDVVPARQIAWGHILRENLEQLQDLENWKEVLRWQIRPALDDAFQKLSRANEKKTLAWVEKYRLISEAMLMSFTAWLESRSAIESQVLKAELDQAAPSLKASPGSTKASPGSTKTSKTLSQKAVRIYRSIPGIHCVLVGMRDPKYVSDILELAPPLSPEETIAALSAAAVHEDEEDPPEKNPLKTNEKL